jgi:hypothetical protein
MLMANRVDTTAMRSWRMVGFLAEWLGVVPPETAKAIVHGEIRKPP